MPGIILNSAQKIAVGQKVLKAARNPTDMTELLNDPKGYLGGDLPATADDHKIIVHVNSARVTHMVVPFHEYLMDGDQYGAAGGAPREFDTANPSFINPAEDAETAYEFRVGDYTLGGCG